MWEKISTFLSENQTSLITNLIAGLVFFIFGPVIIGFSNRKIKKEKLNRAKESYLDLLENMLVNKETVTKEKLTTLFHALNREFNIKLEEIIDIQSLLEDLMLRFAKSKHLSPIQKDEYSTKIETIKHSIEIDLEARTSKTIPKSYKKIFEDIDKNIELNNKENLITSINQIKEKINEEDPLNIGLNIFPFSGEINYLIKQWKRRPIFMSMVLLLIIIIYVFIIFFVVKDK